MIRARGVATNGDSESVRSWSGTSHYLLRAGRQSGFLQSGLDLRLAYAGPTRLAWQAGQVLQGRRPRGFQYSETYLDRLGKKALEQCQRLQLQDIISHFQLLPARILKDHSIDITYYIDSTLQDLFSTHGMLSWLDPRVAEDAIETERAEYHSASRIVTMASWVSESLRETYGLSPKRIHTVLPGANLPEDAVMLRLRDRGPTHPPDRYTNDRPFRIGFTGKDWQRKGLPRLLSAVSILKSRGVPSEVLIIGNLPRQYRSHPSVRNAGFIDKSKELHRFMDLIESCDLGCCPSHEEPMGIAPLEYLRLGVPVICTAAGGLTDVCHAAGSASVLLGKDAPPEEIATECRAIAKDPNRFIQMRSVAWDRKEYFNWDRAVRELQQLWAS